MFIRLWSSRQRLKEVQNFDAYLNRTTRNVVFSVLKEKITNQSLPYELPVADNYANPNDKLQTKELEQHLHQAIASLPEQMQTAFRLSRFEQLTHQQIARVMNISKFTSQNYIARALLYIRRHLSQHTSLLLLLLASLLYRL